MQEGPFALPCDSQNPEDDSHSLGQTLETLNFEFRNEPLQGFSPSKQSSDVSEEIEFAYEALARGALRVIQD